MPELVLHVGFPKTGSTALQKVLRACQDQMREKGVLYPPGGRDDGHKQDYLVPYLYQTTPLTAVRRIILETENERDVRRSTLARARHDPAVRRELQERVQAFAKGRWDSLVEQTRASDITKVILSEELLCNPPEEADTIAHVRKSLAEISDTITVVAYVRSPASRFLSGVGQRLKTMRQVPTVGEKSSYRVAVKLLKDLDIGPVKLHNYTRDKLVDKDITADFQHHYIAEVSDRLVAPPELAEANENISAEAMVIFQHIKGFRDVDDIAQLRRVKMEIHKLDQSIEGFTRPQLLPQARQALIYSAREDLRWLRGEYGIEFGDVDYDDLDTPTDLRGEDLHRVQQFCVLDELRLREMRRRLRSELPGIRNLMRQSA
jgi:hypothetical protein